MFKFDYFPIDEELFENELLCIHLKSMRWYGYMIGRNQNYKLWHLGRCLFITFLMLTFCSLTFIKLSTDAKLKDDPIAWATGCLFLSESVFLVNAIIQKRHVVKILIFLHEDLKGFHENPHYLDTLHFVRVLVMCILGYLILVDFILYADYFLRIMLTPQQVFNWTEIFRGTAQPIILLKLFPFGYVHQGLFMAHILPCIALFFDASVFPLWHTFILTLMKFVQMKLRILENHISKRNVDSFDSNLANDHKHETEQYQQHWVQYCIQEQTKVRWFIKELECILRVPVFIDVLIFSPLFCFLVYGLIAELPKKLDYDCLLWLVVVAYVGAVFCQLYLYHFYATSISEAYHNLGFALYSTKWYLDSGRMQRSVQFLLMSFNVPLRIKAFFVPMGLGTFTQVLRLALSYLGFLRNIDKKLSK